MLFTHNQWFQDIRSEFIGTALRFNENGFGFGFFLNSVGEIENRAPNTGDLLGTFSAYDVALIGAYGRKVREDLSLGLTMKVLYEKMYVYSSSGFAFDLGVLYHSSIENLTFGAAL